MEVAAACRAWIADVASDFKQQGGRLFESVSTPTALATVESALKAGIASWKPPAHSPPGMPSHRERGSCLTVMLSRP